MVEALTTPDPLNELTYSEKLALAFSWRHWRRPEQAPPPGDWDIWMILSGRGWGKTRVGSEMIRERANRSACRMHMVARTSADARDTMIEGISGISAVCRGDMANLPRYEPSKRRITWPNGSKAILFSAEEPDSLRGPACDFWWADEPASWPRIQETWDNLMFGAREGKHVQGVFTTTPRPIKLIKSLMDSAKCVVTRGHTMDNADNLSPSFLAAIRERYEGTRIGRQELAGEILDDNPRALWKRADIERDRLTQAPPLEMIAVGVDPAATANQNSDETGIVVVGRDSQRPPHFYVLDDLSVAMATPDQWGRAVVTAYHRHRANRIVPETNNGGDMIISTIKTVDPMVAIHPVHASRGKYTRAEPVSALSEQGRLHFVGTFPALEDQCCEWEPGSESPDRMDAMVWGVTDMMVSKKRAGVG